MKHVLGFACATILIAAAPAFAQNQPQSRPQPAAAKPIAADQVICEKEEDTGSRLTAHKICHTRSQWEQLRRDDRGALERAQEQRGMPPH